MAEEIKVTVDYANNLKEVVGAAKGLPLTEGQSEKVTKHETGAQLALEAGDLKQFQKHFNALMSIFKDAAAATGQLSAALKTLTDRQATLNKTINDLETKKTGLTTSLSEDGTKLSKPTAEKFAANSQTAQKVKGLGGETLSRDQIVSLQEELVKYLETHKKTLSTLTNADAQAIGFADRRSAQAANKYVKEEGQEVTRIQGEIASTDAELQTATIDSQQVNDELTRLSEASANATNGLNELYKKINEIGNQTNTAITQDTNKATVSGADQTPASGKGFDAGKMPQIPKQENLGGAFKQFTIYALGAKMLKTALKEAVKTVTELDKYLTEQAMVTGMTREQTYKLVGSYQDLALQCGATTKEVAQVATEYLKQGKTMSDAMTLTEAAIKAAKVAGVSVGDSVNYLTTALNGFRLSADQAMRVSDKFAAVAAASATDYDELAIALSKVASQANLAGMSIDYTTALLTKGLETTREAPETMGTALKTIIARMRELGDYGATLDDGMDINNVESQLGYVGIKLRDTNGELRSTQDVLDELGKKWDDLSKNQQAAVAKALAGTRQQARLIAMMEDYERVTELQQISQRSAGATSAQAATYLEGMAAATDKIKVAWEKLVMNMSNSKLIIGAFQTVGKILDGVAGLMEHIEVQVPVFATLGVLAVNALGSKIREHEIAKELNRLALEERIAKQEEQLLAQADLQCKEQVLALQVAQNQEEIAAGAVKAAMIEEQAALKAVADQEEIVQNEVKKEQEIEEAIRADEQLAKEQELLQLKYQEIIANEMAKSAEERDPAVLQDAKEKAKLAKDNSRKAKESAHQRKKELKSQQNSTKKEKEKLDTLNKELKSKRNALKTAKDEYKAAQDTTKEAQANLDTARQKVIEEDKTLSVRQKELGLLKEQAGQVSGLAALWQNVTSIISVIPGVLSTINMLKAIGNKLGLQDIAIKVKEKAATLAAAAAEKIKAAWGMAGSASAIPYAGWIIAGTILAAILGAALIGAGIAALGKVGALEFAGADKRRAETAEGIKQLGAEIYKLEESARSLDTMADGFENLSKKVIKSKEDIQAMEEQLDKMGESMSEETPETGKDATEYDKEIAEITGGKSEKEYYEGLTDEGKVEFARQKADAQRREADRKRDKQVEEMNKLKGGYEEDADGNLRWVSAEENRKKLLKEDQEVRETFYAYNRNQLYRHIDDLKAATDEKVRLSEEEAAFLEQSTQALLDNMDAYDAYLLANDPQAVAQLADTLRRVEVEGQNAMQILEGVADNNGEEITLKQKVAAYKELAETLDGAALKAFELQYAEYEFWTQLSEQALETMDNLRLTNDEINEIYGAYEDINDALMDMARAEAKAMGKDFDSSEVRVFDADEYQNLMHSVWEQLDDDLSNFDEVLTSTFGHIIDKNSDAWAILVNTIGDSIATTILDMGQQMEALDNQINGMYEKASKWGEMSESEKAEFIQDNADLFSGEGGQEMLAAFESGNYDQIEGALAEKMKDKVARQLEEVRKTLAIEMARVGDDRNEAYIRQLQEYEAYLSDSNNLYQASIELRLEQEEAQLEEYRNYLEKEKEALEESLEKRKEAYEKYFESLDQEEEDQDYEEQAAMLVSNLSKLGSSGNADAKNKTAELEKQLEDLEKERLQTLRERAREAVLEDIDDQINDISEKFDELLESNRALLAAMQGDLEDPMKFVSDLIATKASEGVTETELESYIKQLESVYGSQIGGDFFDGVDVRQENGQLILNVNGQEVILSSDDEASVYTAVMTALKQIGKH